MGNALGGIHQRVGGSEHKLSMDLVLDMELVFCADLSLGPRVPFLN